MAEGIYLPCFNRIDSCIWNRAIAFGRINLSGARGAIRQQQNTAITIVISARVQVIKHMKSATDKVEFSKCNKCGEISHINYLQASLEV